MAIPASGTDKPKPKQTIFPGQLRTVPGSESHSALNEWIIGRIESFVDSLAVADLEYAISSIQVYLITRCEYKSLIMPLVAIAAQAAFDLIMVWLG